MQAPSKGNPSNLIDSVFFCNRDYNYTCTVFSWKETITITHTMLCLSNNYECNSHGWCSMGFVTKSLPLGMFNENSQLEAVFQLSQWVIVLLGLFVFSQCSLLYQCLWECWRLSVALLAFTCVFVTDCLDSPFTVFILYKRLCWVAFVFWRSLAIVFKALCLKWCKLPWCHGQSSCVLSVRRGLSYHNV